jgi:hypothetical protein
LMSMRLSTPATRYVEPQWTLRNHDHVLA